MKDLLQQFDSGHTRVARVSVPAAGVFLVVESRPSVVSAGSECVVEFGRARLLQKARGQRSRVRRVRDKARADGPGPAPKAVEARLQAPIPSWARRGDNMARGELTAGPGRE